MSLSRQIVRTDKVEAQRAQLSGKGTKATVTATIAGKLPGMIKDAARKLATAATAAEILDVIGVAGLTYSTAQIAGRIAKAKGAHDQVVAAAHRAQADALDIEAAAKRRLADEYDGAQNRGEIATAEDTKKRGSGVPQQNAGKATAADAGLTRKQVHEARRVRNAEQAKPGVVREALDMAIVEGKEPTRAVVNTAVAEALGEAPAKREKPADPLQDAWDRASEDERAAFLAHNDLVRKAVRGTRTSLSAETVAHMTRGVVNSSMESHEAGNATESVVASPVKPADGVSGAPAANSGNTIPPTRRLRQHCLNPGLCAGSGRNHCHACTKAMTPSEAA